MYSFLINKFLIKKRVYRTSLHNLKKTTTVFRVVRSVTALVVDLCISKFLPGTANMGLAAELALLRRNVFLVRPLPVEDCTSSEQQNFKLYDLQHSNVLQNRSFISTNQMFRFED